MIDQQHIVRSFDRDLEAIQAMVMKMGGMVEAAILSAGEALEAQDDDLAEKVRTGLDATSGASAWNGKLVARLRAVDGFGLRKTLIPVLEALAGGLSLPRVWSM